MSDFQVALVGNPNCGKTALFNRLTGARQKVANYAGVTVERKLGYCQLSDTQRIEVIDLPGTYSLNATSPDEAVTIDILQGKRRNEAQPDLLICVVDATNLRLHLRFVLELMQLNRPMLVALNMVDSATRRGIEIDRPALSKALGIQVIDTIAIQKNGDVTLRQALLECCATLPIPPQTVVGDLHARVNTILSAVTHIPRATSALDDQLDDWALHPLFGPLILAAVLFLMFQAVFAWAEPLQNGIEFSIQWLRLALSQHLPPGPLQSLLSDGLLAGAGSVLVFLPQIMLLFLCILFLEESGYLPRAAFLLDRLMSHAGLSGRAVIPLLSSFACAVPGIMATRSIQNPRERLVTILVAPLMTCSARLPIYALLIAAFIPPTLVLGVFNLQGVVLFGLYLLAMVSALIIAWVMKRLGASQTAQPGTLLLELPSWRWPNPRDIAYALWERCTIFLKRVGGIILALSVLLWLLATFPTPPENWPHSAIEYSFAGRIGYALQQVFAPLGFNWQICIALIPGLAAREVAISALATVYAIGSANQELAVSQLTPLLAQQWSLGTGLALLAWYVYAPQCISTLAVMRRETGSWRPVGIALAYLFALAWIMAWLAHQLGRLIG